MKNTLNENPDFITFKCATCNSLEKIPTEVVDYFDIMDGGDPTVPPKFACKICNNEMSPVYYVSHDGIIYKS